MRNELKPLIGKSIVVDTNSNWVYLGILDHVTETCIVLKDADAHDIRRGVRIKPSSTKLTIPSEWPWLGMPRQLPGWF